MLYLPPKFNVLSIDPGNNMGITISEFDMTNKEMHIIECYTLVVDKVLRTKTFDQLNTFDSKELIREWLEDTLIDLMVEYDVDMVVYEAAYHSKSLNAYESLLFYGRVIKEATRQYDWYVDCTSITPSSVKKNIGVKGNSNDKDLVKKAVLSTESIKFDRRIDCDSLTEHAFDSVAIGYYAFSDLIRALETKRNKESNKKRRK